MATSSHRTRIGALAVAAGLALGAFASAAPASAEEIVPVISLDRTEFPAGDWAGGFTITGSGFDADAESTQVYVGANGENGGGSIYAQDLEVAADGTIEALVLPDAATSAPDENGYPYYSVSVSQQSGEEYLPSPESVRLTITAGTSLTAPEEVSPEQVAAGVSAQFAGFAAGEPMAYGFGLFREGELLDSVEEEATADAAGAGTISAALEGAQIGDYIQIYAEGQESGRIAESFIQVVEAPAPAPAPAPDAGTPAAPVAEADTAATGPQLAETGVELGAGTAALAFLVLGAGAVFLTRRMRAAQR